MDYDENDFQSQNFQLVGEDKFSVNLRSFLLPRFDLDEHLSFHGLVEEQVLGIQGQENNWIDFPPGSSALEFSSSAAESCSIARHNNVWSEATSSESVDLLLKSVGEDEMINDKAVIMDMSANDESHGVDDQEVLYGGRGDSHESSMMDFLHVAPEFAHHKCQKNFPGTDEGQLELLSNNAQGSFQPAEGEESRIAIYVEPSNRNHNPDEKIDVGQYKLVDIVTSLYNGIAKSKADDSDLCAVLYEKDVCEVLLKTEVPSSDESDSCVVDAGSLASNQDKLDIEAEKLNTGLLGVGQDQSNIRDSSAFLCDHVHKEKSLVKHCDDKTNCQLASKSDALELLNTNCIDSVFSGNSGLVMTVPCETKSLNGNRGASEKSYAKDECMSPLAVEQVERIGHNSVILQTVPQLKEGSRSIGDSLTCDSVKDDVHVIRIQLVKNSAMSCDDRGGKLKTRIDAIDNNQDLQGELVEKKNVDIAIATQLLIESPASIHANYETRTEIKECERMSTNSLSFTCEKPGLVVEVNHDNDMDVERQEVKLDEIKDAAPDESSLPVAVVDESCLPITVTDSRMSPSTCCKSSLYKATVSVTDLKEVHIEQVHVSVGKETTITCIIPSKISSDPVSNVMEKARDLPPAIQDTAEGLPLKGSEKKLLEEKLDFDPLSPPLEKSSSLHLSTSELATNIDLAVGKSESLIQVLSASNVIDFDNKDVKITGATASSSSTTDSIEENESDLGSFSYPLNMRDTPSEKVSKGAQLASLVKPTDSQPSKGFSCVKDTSTDHLGNSVVQAPSLVRSGDFTQPQNDILSLAGNGVRSGKTLPLEGNAVEHRSFQEGNDDIPNLLVVSHVGNEVPVALAQITSGRHAVHIPPSIDDDSSCKSSSNGESDQCKLARRDISDEQNLSAQTKDILLTSHMINSQICTGSIIESKSSEALIGNSSSSERNCVLPLVINCRGCHQDYSEHQERSKGLHVEARSSTPEASTSEDLAGAHAGSELSFLNFKAIDIPQIPKEKSQGLLEEVKVLESSKKNSNLGKSKNASRPSNGKKTVSKGKTKIEPHALKQTSAMNVKSFSSTFKSIGTLNMDIPSVEMREQLNDHSIKTSSVGFQTSVIPDLNSSSSSALFHQPFTDPQQVQLRAQIFVYGALISGMPPDEAYMLSAFGDSDGGRNLWEGLWHAWILRFQNRKSPVGCCDTPTQSRPGNDVQIEVPSTSATSDSISISSSVFNSTMPLPSSLRSHSYENDGHHASVSRGTYLNFSQTPSPLPHQTSVSRQHVVANSPLSSQSPRPGPWFVSSQIAPLDGIKRYSTVSVPETVHVTPVRDSCGPHRPTVEVIPLSILMSIPDTSITNTADLRKETSKRAAASGNSKYNQTPQKARKRKKSESAEGTSVPASRTLPESVSAVSDVRSLPLSSTNTHRSSNSQLNVATPPPALISAPHIISATHYQIIDANNQQKAILSEETCSKIELAKHQAEDAAALAATTVKHSHDIWSQLLSQKNFGFISLNEEKLASAAVVAAVASSVAKAAAAAANVAVGAALQAKLMADEAVSVAKDDNTVLNSDSGVLDVGKKLVGISPVSILKGMDQIHGFGAIISAASEVTRRQVDSASAATKRAENMDAIVKAAELAAEAVAQAGTVITMGDPLPFTLSQLADAGPEGFWRGHDGSFMKLFKSRITHGAENLGLVSAKEHDGSAKQLDGQFSKDEDTQKAIDEGGLSSLNEYHEQFEARTQGTFPIAGVERDHSASSIKKGSVVEVMSDEDGRKGAWFSAQVLDIDDNKAYVCYDDVSTAEGWLKEWILLEEGDKAPRIRTSHSTAFVKYEGTRKRRREHLGSYIWGIGDHVDAWIRDSWWEGTVIEKIPGDETKLTVRFAARGDNQVVHTWNLRPSRVWKDGQWMEWSHAKGKPIKPPEGDTPTEKRQRLGRSEENIHSEVDAAEMDKLSRSTIIEESRKPDDSELHVFSAKDRTFSIGKNSRDEVISDAVKPKRTGLQKERSKVVFGVPRPGKKRKFMEVSKHYVASKSEKVSEGNDSIKFAKYLMPQASRQSRSTSKVDNKGKNAVVIKTRGDFKAENSQSFQTRSLSEKDKASLSLSNEDVIPVHDKDVISCFTGSNNFVDNINTFKFSSFPSQAVKTDVSAVVPEDSVQSAPVPYFKKRKNSGSKMDLTEKPKFSMDGTSNVGDKSSGNNGKAIYEVMEPRRSNRRIQPTSRLLEGLQSSLVISKIINVSHERKPSRGGSTSKGHKLV